MATTKKKKLQDYIHLYVGQYCMTPDGVAKITGLPWNIVDNNRIDVHFDNMVKTIHSVDGGYNKTRNHGGYNITEKHYVGIMETMDSIPEFTIPGGIKLILRSLSDMTEEELHFINMSKLELNHAISQKTNASFYTTEFIYFLSKGFDLFNLIEEGLAIDKTTLK